MLRVAYADYQLVIIIIITFRVVHNFSQSVAKFAVEAYGAMRRINIPGALSEGYHR